MLAAFLKQCFVLQIMDVINSTNIAL